MSDSSNNLVYRGEVTLNSCSKRKNEDWVPTDSKSQPPRGALVDGSLQGPDRCELFVIEASKDQGDGRFTAKLQSDYNRVARHLSDMLWDMEKKVGTRFIAKPGVQLLGCLMPGAAFSCYGLSHKGYVSYFFQLGKKYNVPPGKKGIRRFLDILKFAARIRICLNDMVEKFNSNNESAQDEGTCFPCLATPDKSKKTRKSAAHHESSSGT